MDAVEVVRRLGGTAEYESVVAHSTRASLRRAVAEGLLLRPSRGVYAVPELSVATTAAAASRGVLSHTTAAGRYGLALATAPSLLHVTVPPGARPRPLDGVRLHWSALRPDEVVGGLTSVLRTVLDCAVTLPFDEALAVADSALGERLLTVSELLVAAQKEPLRRRGRCVKVAHAADGGAQTLFESCTRAVLLDGGIRDLRTQHAVLLPAFTAHVDIADPRRRIAVEAESYEYHSDRQAFARDCERYSELAAADWLVLRFTWNQVRFRPDWVVDVVRRTQALRQPQVRRYLATPRPRTGVSSSNDEAVARRAGSAPTDSLTR